MIYFLEALEDWTAHRRTQERLGSGLIKIGTTARLSVRLKQITSEIDHTPRVLAVMDGSYADESVLHERFGNLRVFGEWFEPHAELAEFIATEGREWNLSDDAPLSGSGRDDATTKFDRILLAKAKVVAANKGIPVAEYLSELCRPMIDKDSARFVRDVDKRDSNN